MAEQDEQVQQGVTVRVGDTWESMDPREDQPRRRVQVIEIFGDHATVENASTRHQSAIRVDRFVPPHWRFVG